MAGPVDVQKIPADPDDTFALTKAIGAVIEESDAGRTEIVGALLTLCFIILYPKAPRIPQNLQAFVGDSSTFMSTYDLPFPTDKAVAEYAKTGVVPEVPVATVN